MSSLVYCDNVQTCATGKVSKLRRVYGFQSIWDFPQENKQHFAYLHLPTSLRETRWLSGRVLDMIAGSRLTGGTVVSP